MRFWDVRRSVSELGVLDHEDSIGALGKPSSDGNRHKAQAKAHGGPVNGMAWTEDGNHLVTCGHDQRIRVWDTNTGANTLANFGPLVRNSGLAPRIPVLVPVENLEPEKDVLFYPNGHEILGYEMFEGKLIRRLRRPEEQKRAHEVHGAQPKGQRNARDNMTALAWRAHDVEMYSAHADGSIAAWKPRTDEDVELDEQDADEAREQDDGRKRKRGVLDDIYQGLMKKPITFSGM